jgi:hypothetical protein
MIREEESLGIRFEQEIPIQEVDPDRDGVTVFA